MSREDDIRKLIVKYSRHLQKLEEQKASFGLLHAPAHLLNEIEETKTELEKLENAKELLENLRIEEKLSPRSESKSKQFVLLMIGGGICILLLALAIVLFYNNRGGENPPKVGEAGATTLGAEAIQPTEESPQTPSPTSIVTSATFVDQPSTPIKTTIHSEDPVQPSTSTRPPIINPKESATPTPVTTQLSIFTATSIPPPPIPTPTDTPPSPPPVIPILPTLTPTPTVLPTATPLPLPTNTPTFTPTPPPPTVPPCINPQPARILTNNRLDEPGIEDWGVSNEPPYQWRTHYWTSYPNNTPIFPDNVLPHEGCYSARVEGRGSDPIAATLSHNNQIDLSPNRPLKLTFYYRTEEPVQVTMTYGIGTNEAPTQYLKQNELLVASPGIWTPMMRDIDVPSLTGGTNENVVFLIKFAVSGTGKFWIDDASLEEVP